MILKASCVTNLTDARYFAAKEVDYLGFNLEEGSEGYLDPMYMKAIREWVAGPKIVGEFSSAPASYVAEAARFLDLQVVQVGMESPAELSSLVGLEVILKIDGNKPFQNISELFKAAAPFVTCFVLDFSNNNNWESILYEQASTWNELIALRPTLLDANLEAGQLSHLFNRINLAGLNLMGGEEEQVGVKSFDQLDELFEACQAIAEAQ